MPIRSRAELNIVNPPGQIKTLGDYVKQVEAEENVVDPCAWPYPTKKAKTFLEWWWDPETDVNNLTPKELAEKAWFAAKANT